MRNHEAEGIAVETFGATDEPRGYVGQTFQSATR